MNAPRPYIGPDENAQRRAARQAQAEAALEARRKRGIQAIKAAQRQLAWTTTPTAPCCKARPASAARPS